MGGHITAAKLGQSCKKGGFTGAKFQCCKSPAIVEPEVVDPEPSEPAQKCFVDSIGTNTQYACYKAEFLKASVYKTCAAAGAQLESAKLGQPCKKNGYTGVKFQCCKSAPVIEDDSDVSDNDLVSVDTSDDGPAQKCYTNVVGEDLCLDAKNLKHWVSKECHSAGGDVTGFSLGQKCKGNNGYGYEGAKFSCCVTAVTGGQCGTDSISTKPSMDKKPSMDEKPSTDEKPSMDEKSSTDEKPSKTTVIDINLDKKEGPMCVNKSAGSPDTCMSAASWKKTATSKCAGADMNVTQAAMGVECKGGFRYAKWTCCGN
jgi:hypothetical protein